ncbi:MAG: phosphate ABC transporter permease subunit PstC [Thaumarchaeota archaeon]|nr:phosphate ABC transporter permease subunit PstC [Nitrososphaerota archaeon]
MPKEITGDRVFTWLAAGIGSSVIIIIFLMAYELIKESRLAIDKYGLGFVWGTTWDPVFFEFGALPLIWGTLVTSAIALLLAVPVSIGVALVLSHFSPVRFRFAISFLVELLAAIPSVVYGLWGLFTLAPILRDYIYPPISSTLGSVVPILAPPVIAYSVMTGGVILAIMIIPTISAITRDAFAAVPLAQREAVISLGATRWETARLVMSYARSGIIGATILGLGRAVGETMAVTMVIGNRFEIPSTLFQPGYTMAAIIANEFTEATEDIYLSALIEVGLVLFAVALVINMFAQIIVRRSLKMFRGAVRE